mmetsp:Transcript_16369/g.45356  ORF Transcript_16369/g.45356 Transcript_16369/m.45356 type:complete len:192 (-) Transcript_16369:124-699(-)
MTTTTTGLGLRTPSPEFWQPIGEQTGAMNIDDKINLLAYLVPRFGTGDAEQDKALKNVASGLKPTFALIRSKCPSMEESDVQLLGTELLSAEILVPGRSTLDEFAAWISAMTPAEMEEVLANRKTITSEAKSELDAYKQQVEEDKKKREELRKQYEEQVQKAREERSMAFNPASGKFQEIKKEAKETTASK